MEPSRNNNAEKLLATALVGFGAWTIATTTQPLGWLTSLGSFAAAETIIKRREYTHEECLKGSLEYAQDLLGEWNGYISPTIDSFHQKKNAVFAYCLKQVGLQGLAEQWANTAGLETEWFDALTQFDEGVQLVVSGVQGDGKTHFLLWLTQTFLERTQGKRSKLYICDLDVGYSHAGSKPNWWFGLGKTHLNKVVFSDPSAIKSIILNVAQQLENQRNDSDPILLIIDEWVSFINCLEDDEVEEVRKAIKSFNTRGGKRNVSVAIGLHSFAKEETQLSRADLGRFWKLLLKNSAGNSRNYDNFGIDKNLVVGLIRQIAGLPKTVLGKRPCIVIDPGNNAAIRAIPHLEVSETLDLIEPDETDPDERWIAETLTVEKEAAIVALMARRQQEGKKPVAYQEIANLVEFPAKDRLNSNRRYQLLKVCADRIYDKHFAHSQE